MDDVEKALRARKTAFLDKMANRIDSYIVSTGKNCIAIVERNTDGSIRCTWNFNDDIDDLCKMVYLFMRKKRAKSGCELDSALTDPIIEIVREEYEEFYQSESEAISQGVLTALATDEIKLTKFVDRILGIALHNISDKGKKKVLDLIVHQIKQSVSQGTLHVVGQQIAHVATTSMSLSILVHRVLIRIAAGMQVAAIVAQILLKLMAAHMGAVVAKVLASAALQHVLIGLAKKFILAAVTAAVFQFLTVHFGAALAGASVLWVVIPIIAGYMVYKIATFPKELGKSVSKSVRKEIDRNFDSMNKTVLEKIFHTVFEGNELVDAIARDPDFQDTIRKLGEKVEATKENLSVSIKRSITGILF
jgi:hypothetical protein